MNKTLSKALVLVTVLAIASVAVAQDDGTATTTSSLFDFSSPLSWLLILAVGIFFPIWVSWGGLKIIFPATG